MTPSTARPRAGRWPGRCFLDKEVLYAFPTIHPAPARAGGLHGAATRRTEIAVTPDFGATVANEVSYAHPVRVTWMDTDQSLGEPWDVRLVGFDPADHPVCNDGELVGGIPALGHHLVTQEGFPDELSQRDQGFVTTIGRPPLYLYLRSDQPASGASADEWCTFLTEGWIASGHWSATLARDTDFSWMDNTPGMEVYGGTEQGVLWGPDGAMYRYEWKYTLQWFPELGVDRFVNHVDHVVRIK